MGLDPVRGRAQGFGEIAQGRDPDLLGLCGKAKAPGSEEEQDRPDQQGCLAFKSPERAQENTKASCNATPFRIIAHQILESLDGLAGKAEGAQPSFYARTVRACVGIHP